MSLLALGAFTASAAPLEITIADPMVVALVLECADGTFKSVVKNGLATFDQVPNNCVVNAIRKSGTINSPGRWTCTLDTCTQQDTQHEVVTDAPGRLNVIVTTPLPPGAWLELICDGGVRQRTDLTVNTGIFEGVPAGECTLHFKGTVPARFRPIREGTWSCGISGTTAVCTQR